ncbi:hypothetical protein [Clostridium perfringens]|uniref:hypothetical protein n=1 Tax=Clostridium perfringens TaxID=1502 RepID=UPI0013E3B648|nr:hypothetical protein [Clostridium perfringens]EJT5934038.1 hypothetical protein [Clostridium perfringens]ELC8347527.1 hypothetical protein [Clostridium perfringens]MDK0830153.1 hypothetical protein [Clostridium perfringens]MDU2442863.1 hypothetical protein [Clostridium perfringens]NGT03812.1 hypothetical protein [Clostridium perfringens]
MEDIKNDFIDTYKNHIDRDCLNPCVNWFISENYLYMTDKYPVEEAFHYIAIGAYLICKNKIKESYNLIKDGIYDKYFDKKYIDEDIETIKQSNLF